MNLARRKEEKCGNSELCRAGTPTPGLGHLGYSGSPGGCRGGSEAVAADRSQVRANLSIGFLCLGCHRGIPQDCGKAAERKMVQTHKQLFGWGTVATVPSHPTQYSPFQSPGDLGCSTWMEAQSGVVQSAETDRSWCKQTGGKRAKAWFDVKTARE